MKFFTCNLSYGYVMPTMPSQVGAVNGAKPSQVEIVSCYNLCHADDAESSPKRTGMAPKRPSAFRYDERQKEHQVFLPGGSRLDQNGAKFFPSFHAGLCIISDTMDSFDGVSKAVCAEHYATTATRSSSTSSNGENMAWGVFIGFCDVDLCNQSMNGRTWSAKGFLDDSVFHGVWPRLA